MPLELNEKLRARLIERLVEALPKVQVRNGQYIHRESLGGVIEAESAMPSTGKQAEAIQQKLGDLPFLEFVSGTISRELSETFDYNSDADLKPLTQVAGYEDVQALAQRLVDSFESLPWNYSVSMPLPAEFGKLILDNIGDVRISKSLTLRSGKTLDKTHPLESANQKRNDALSGSVFSLFSMGANKGAWSEKQAYLQVELTGYIDQYGSTETMERALDQVKAFYGFALALGILKYKWAYYGGPQGLFSYVHREEDAKWIPESRVNVQQVDGDLHRLLVLEDLGGLIKPDRAAGWASNQLKAIGWAFNAGESADYLRLAARWFWDSHTGQDELLQFIQCAVVVEILLGEKAASDGMGITEMLANRCAYLIAKTHDERAELIADFKKIYFIRSKIVHNGKRRLGANDRPLFHRLKWICRRIIQAEVELLKNAVKDEG